MDNDKLFKKLRLQPEQNLLIVNLPEQFTRIFNGIGFDSSPNVTGNSQYDFVLLFARSESELKSLLNQVKDYVKYDGLFWVSYPKLTSDIESDLKREVVWKAMDAVSLKTVTQIAIDETWSAMRGRPKEQASK